MKNTILITIAFLSIPLSSFAELIKVPQIDKYSVIESISTFEDTPEDIREDMQEILDNSHNQESGDLQVEDLSCEFVGKSKLALCQTSIAIDKTSLEAEINVDKSYNIESVHFMNSYEPLRVTIK